MNTATDAVQEWTVKTMRLIDADALKESLIETLHRCDEWIENAKDGETRTIAESNYTAFLESILRVKDAPTVDAEPVIRCEECKHLVVLNARDLYAHCKRHDIRFEPFGYDTRTNYCSWAERKDDE